jgi:hypothetical protein
LREGATLTWRMPLTNQYNDKCTSSNGLHCRDACERVSHPTHVNQTLPHPTQGINTRYMRVSVVPEIAGRAVPKTWLQKLQIPLHYVCTVLGPMSHCVLS